jgi:hypothetical protein
MRGFAGNLPGEVFSGFRGRSSQFPARKTQKVCPLCLGDMENLSQPLRDLRGGTALLCFELANGSRGTSHLACQICLRKVKRLTLALSRSPKEWNSINSLVDFTDCHF